MRTRFLGLVAVVFALLLAAAAPASAATDITYSQDQSRSSRGAGQATASATADRNTGAMSADASATGGGNASSSANPLGSVFGGLFGALFGPSGPSSARGQIFVNGGEVVPAGQYRVTVTFTGADTDESATGSGTSRGSVSSQATNFAGGENFAVVGSAAAELPSQPGTVVLTYDVILNNENGVSVSATLTSEASANGQGNSATTGSDVQATSIDIQPIG